MKKILLFFVFLSSLFLQAQEKLIINDPLAVMRDMGIFDEIDVRGPFKVYYSVGKKHTVAISAGTESARDRIRVSKSGSRLIIELEDTYKDWFKSQPRFKIYISSPTVNYISASGAVDFFVTDLLSSDDLKIRFTGASDFLGKLDCENLNLRFTGASDIELTGKVTALNAVLTGASKLKAATLKVENADIKVSGASNSTISVSNKMNALATGASHITYYGNPPHVDVRSSGASKIKRAD